MDIPVKEENCSRKRAASFAKPDDEIHIGIIKIYKTKIEWIKPHVNSFVIKQKF